MEQTENPPPYTQAAPYRVPPPAAYHSAQQGYAETPQGYMGPQGGYPPQQQGYVMPPAYPTQQPNMQQQSNNTVVIQQPGVQGSNTVSTAHVPNYTVSSLFVLFCCPFTGLFAIYFAQRSRSELVAGNTSGAQRLAANARTMIIASVVCGIVWIITAIMVNVTRTSKTCYNYDC